MKPKKRRPAPIRSNRSSDPHTLEASHIGLDPLFEGQIDYLVRMIRMREVRAIEILLGPLDLMLSTWYPLAVLHEIDGMSQRDLGNRLNLKDAAIGKAVDAMERSGLVERMTGKDRRKALVFLTKSGKKITEQVLEKRQQLLNVLCKDFSEEEVQQFSSFLQRCYSSIDKFVEENSA